RDRADLPGLERLHQVAMDQALSEPPFVDEELNELMLLGVMRENSLEHHEAPRAGVVGEEDLRHPPERERAHDAAPAELRRQLVGTGQGRRDSGRRLVHALPSSRVVTGRGVANATW